MEDWILYWNQSGHQADVINLDLLLQQKVFDRVPHARLISKVNGSYKELMVNCYNGLKIFYPIGDSECV